MYNAGPGAPEDAEEGYASDVMQYYNDYVSRTSYASGYGASGNRVTQEANSYDEGNKFINPELTDDASRSCASWLLRYIPEQVLMACGVLLSTIWRLPSVSATLGMVETMTLSLVTTSRESEGLSEQKDMPVYTSGTGRFVAVIQMAALQPGTWTPGKPLSASTATVPSQSTCSIRMQEAVVCQVWDLSAAWPKKHPGYNSALILPC